MKKQSKKTSNSRVGDLCEKRSKSEGEEKEKRREGKKPDYR
jgi:hypothetical protein